MTGTPCCLALAITAAADGESRLTINSTLAPPLSIWSAIVANFALSPFAFWMSASTPAAWNARGSSGRSVPSQRADEAVSGRITPTLAFAVAVAVAVPLLDDEAESSLPQAATPNASAAVVSTTGKLLLLIASLLRDFRTPISSESDRNLTVPVELRDFHRGFSLAFERRQPQGGCPFPFSSRQQRRSEAPRDVAVAGDPDDARRAGAGKDMA